MYLIWILYMLEHILKTLQSPGILSIVMPMGEPSRIPYEQLKNAINRRSCYKKAVPLSTVGEWHCFDLKNGFIWIIPDQVIYSISMLFYFAAPYDLSVLQIPCYHIGICF